MSETRNKKESGINRRINFDTPSAGRAEKGNAEDSKNGVIVAQHKWPNGMLIETRYKEDSFNDEPSDCISLAVLPGKGRGDKASFYLNVEDATAIIHSLSAAIALAIEDRKSAWPVNK